VKIAAFTLILIFSLSKTGCEKQNSSESLSQDCIERIIAEIQSKPVQNPPITIMQYKYQGVFVYYVPAPCCDQLNPVYNIDCTIRCYPDGGINGKGDGKCLDFFTLSKDKKIVWKDDRVKN